MDDDSLLFNSQKGGSYLIKIDKNGNVQKIQDQLLFHHSINEDSKGLIYASISNKKIKMMDLRY